MAVPAPFNFEQWIADNADQLRPPVNNKVLHTVDDALIVQVVGGPNQRTDFHVDPYPEWFHQVKGAMHVNVMDDGRLRRIDLDEGDVWMLPANVPHSPQRPEPGSIGIVVEVTRPEGMTERFQWYCPQCSALVHEAELQVRDIQADLPPVFAAFYASSEADRTCPSCGAVHPGKG